MKTQQHLNTSIQNCDTCAHYRPHNLGREFAHCAKYQAYTWRALPECKYDHWQAKPPLMPRRSLRQWLYDLFWSCWWDDL